MSGIPTPQDVQAPARGKWGQSAPSVSSGGSGPVQPRYVRPQALGGRVELDEPEEDSFNGAPAQPQAQPQQPQPRRTQTEGYAIVKEVRSADTVVLFKYKDEVSKWDAPLLQKTIRLSDVAGPRRTNKVEGDDEAVAREWRDNDYFWQAQDATRKLLLGKQVRFKVMSAPQNSGVEYGDLFLGPRGADRSVREHLLREGWVDYRPHEALLKRCEEATPDFRDKNPGVVALYDAWKEGQEAQRGRHGLESNPKLKQHHKQRTITRAYGAQWDRRKSMLLKDKHTAKYGDQFRGFPGVVDRILDGGTFVVELTNPSGTLEHKQVRLHLSGLRVPKTQLPKRIRDQQYARDLAEYEKDPEEFQRRYRKSKPTKPTNREAPWSQEAKRFMEVRLLQRDVEVIPEVVDGHGNIFGSLYLVDTPKINVQALLLMEGYADVEPWSLRTNSYREMLQNVLANAQARQLRRWQGYQPSASGRADSDATSFAATVIQVFSGDQLLVKPRDGGAALRVNLSSIRAPRKANVRWKTPEIHPKWAHWSKERLVSLAVQQPVTVQVDYTRSLGGGAAGRENRPYCTILVRNQNLGERLVREGLAEVIKHGPKDADRSRAYDALLLAQDTAQKDKKGIHGGKVPGPEPLDFTLRRNMPEGKESEAKAQVKRIYEAYNKSARPLNARVEHVFSGHHCKVYIPKENAFLSFSIGGIECNRSVTPQQKADIDSGKGKITKAMFEQQYAFGGEAREFTSGITLQQNVKLFFDNIPKSGATIIGRMLKGKKNIAHELLKNGYAKLNSFIAERVQKEKENFEWTGQAGRFCQDSEWALGEALAGAQKARLRLWKNYVPPQAKKRQRKDEEEAAAQVEFKEGSDKVVISEVVDACNFYVTFVEQRDDIAKVDACLEEISAKIGFQAPYEPISMVPDTQRGEGMRKKVNRGETVLAAFEGGWYRGKVIAQVKDTVPTKYSIHFIDFGSTASLKKEELRKLDVEKDHPLRTIVPVAKKATLVGLAPPPEAGGFFRPAGFAFRDLTHDHKYQVQAGNTWKSLATEMYSNADLGEVSLKELNKDVADAELAAGEIIRIPGAFGDSWTEPKVLQMNTHMRSTDSTLHVSLFDLEETEDSAFYSAKSPWNKFEKKSINEYLIADGLCSEIQKLDNRAIRDQFRGTKDQKYYKELHSKARKLVEKVKKPEIGQPRIGMWQYGEVFDDEDEGPRGGRRGR